MWILLSGVDMATLNIVGQENGLSIDLFEKSLEDFYFAPSAVAINRTGMAPTKAYFPLFFIDAHLGFRDVKEFIFILQ